VLELYIFRGNGSYFYNRLKKTAKKRQARGQQHLVNRFTLTRIIIIIIIIIIISVYLLS